MILITTLLERSYILTRENGIRPTCLSILLLTSLHYYPNYPIEVPARFVPRPVILDFCILSLFVLWNLVLGFFGTWPIDCLPVYCNHLAGFL